MSNRTRMWVLVGLIVGLVLVPIYVIAFSLVARTSLLNFHGGPLSSAQVSAVWAFVGACFATGVTLLGLVLTYQHNDRTHQLAKEAEDRLRLDSVVRGLELLTDGAKYAPKARVAGSLATLVRLGHLSIAVATLRTAWKADAVDAETATWLADRVLETGSADDVQAISSYMLERASDLAFEWEHGVITILPRSLEDNWDVTWPTRAKTQFIGTLALAHISVRRGAWEDSNQILVRSLWKAAQDPDPYVATTAVKVLLAIAPAAEDLRPVFGTNPSVAATEAVKAHEKIAKLAGGMDYFPRITDLVKSIEEWRSSSPRRTARLWRRTPR